MAKLWNQRLNQYQKKILRYLRYVFNDHFIIALFFIFGAICYGYVKLIDNYIQPQTFLDSLIAIVILLIILQIGKFATLLKQPDIVFLLPNDYRIDEYLKKAVHHGMIVNGIIQSILTLFLVPFLVKILDFTLFGWIVILVSQILFKSGELILDKVELFNEDLKKVFLTIKFLFPSLGIICGILINPILDGCIAVIYLLSISCLQNKWQQKHVFKWKSAVELEEKRMMKIYKFFSLFTDVPEVQQTIKRRKYMDMLLPRYKSNKKQTYIFLYWRGFWRSPEYSSLFIRLTVIGGLLIGLTKIKWLVVLVACLFVYLTGFQLIPLAEQYYDNVFTHLYPISLNLQQQAFKKMLINLELIQIITFVIILFFMSHSFITTLFFAGSSLLIVWILSGQILKKRMIKMA